MSTRHPFDTATFKLIYVHPDNLVPGATFDIILPQPGRIEVISAYFTFTASAAVANRIPFVGLLNGAVPVYQWLPPRAHAASITTIYSCGRGEPQEPGVAPVAGHAKISLGVGMIFDNVDHLIVSSELLDGGDQFSNLHLWYKFWIDGTFPV